MSGREGYTVVLGGGGAKGSYQIGAWKALRENRIPIQAVSGASVGALNAALMAQGSFDQAEEIWEKISLTDVVEVPDGLMKEGRLTITPEVFTDLKLLKEVWNTGLRLDSAPLRQLLKKYVDEKAIRKSGIDLGVVTINTSELKPLELFLSDMEEGLLADYLLASASLPIFKQTKIKGNHFLDGGFHDNIPFAMMKNRGYRRFIVVDVSGLGNNRRPDIIGTETIYIKNSLDMGGILDFSPEFIKRYRLLGYLDTQKILGNNRGLKYFFGSSRSIEKKLGSLLTTPEVRKLAGELAGSAAENDIRKLLPTEYRTWQDPVPALAECAAAALKIERVRYYEMDDFLSLIWNSRNEIEKKAPPVEKPQFLDFFGALGKKIKEINPDKLLTGYSPQEFLKATEILTGKKKSAVETAALLKIFPELAGAQVFFRMLDRYFHE